jgi:aldehyde dehydrogenase (NAD+)
MYGHSTKEERAEILRRLHQVVSARIDALTAAMVEEYGGPAGFSRAIIEAAANVFLAAEKALQELPLTRSSGKTTATLEPPVSMKSTWTAPMLQPKTRAATN